MKKDIKVFIIHGAYGSPGENWFPYLRERLEQKGISVICPQFPTPKNQSLENWMKKIDLKDIGPHTILVGHSLGAAFILSILEKIDIKVKACFLVGGFLGTLGYRELDNINNPFTVRKFDWAKIKSSCKRFFIYNSDNDPYVHLEKGEELAQKLGSKLIIVKGAGHFNKAAGYTRFERLLEDIEPLVN